MSFSEMLWLGSAALVPVLLGVILVMFLADLRRLERREPIHVLFLRDVRDGDPLYTLAMFEVMAPYSVAVALSALMGFAALGMFEG